VTYFIQKHGIGAKHTQSCCNKAEILRNINQLHVELLLLFYFTFVMNSLLMYWSCIF